MRNQICGAALIFVAALAVPVSPFASESDAETIAKLGHGIPAPQGGMREFATLNGAIAGTLAPVDLMKIEGMSVSGADGEALGMVSSIDIGAQEVELRNADGITVTLPSALLGTDGHAIVAPTTSHADVMAMMRTQAAGSEMASL